ncbi:MAG: FAD-dependent oxidoreductase [Desulfoprunum sp.]|nr:FAD-dependent oxidoreductase [Desulfoprunum sp.]
MARFDYDIGVIGGGAAGLTVASGASQLGAKTLLVEKEGLLGGDCLHFGCVPSKTLIKTAGVYQMMKEAGRYGLPTPNVGPVDFSLVAGRIRQVVEQIQQHDSVERFVGLGVQVSFGQAVFTDAHTISLAGRPVTAGKWLVATGSSPAIPLLEGLADVPYLTNRDIFSLTTLPQSLIILGAGAIAVEMAQAFCRLGAKVTVLQRGEQILSKEDLDMAEIVRKSLVEEGVIFHLGCKLLRVGLTGQDKEVFFSDSHGLDRSVVGAQILVALGRSANIDGLGLEDIGIACSSRGIEVDTRLRTSHKHIYAAGDVIGGYQFTHAAGYEGGVVLTNAILGLPRKVDYSWMPWCTYTSPELASIGLNEKRAKAAGIDYRLWTEQFAANDRANAEAETVGFIKLLLDRKSRPLGVQILGPHAGDLLAEWVAVLNGGVKLSTLAGAIHPYPTLAEINKRVVGNIYSPKLFSDTVRKALKLIFRYQGRAVASGGKP